MQVYANSTMIADDLTGDDSRDAQEQLRQWKITAVGNRPQDWFVRGLLHTALLRDARPTWYHKIVQHPPAWMKDMVGHLPDNHRPTAIRHLGLHYLHLRSLSNLASTLTADSQESTTVKKLIQCWPSGVMVEPVNVWEKGRPRTCCLPRLCPWCHARQAQRVHQRLNERIVAGNCPSRLVRARAVIDSDFLGPMVGLQKISPDSYQNWHVQGGNPFLPPNFNHILHEEHVNYVRKVLGKEMIDAVRKLGVSGGMLIYQVSPYLTSAGLRAFQHELLVVGEATFVDEGQEKRFQTEIGMFGPPYLGIGPEMTAQGHNRRIGLQILALPAAHPMAARFLLAGTEPEYPIHELDAWASDRDLKRTIQYGIQGAFALPPTFMFDPTQWLSHATVMKGKHHHKLFGTWKTDGIFNRRSEQKSDKCVGFSTNHNKYPPQKANHARRNATLHHREKLLEVVMPRWDAIIRDNQGLPGRPNLRKPILRALEASGAHYSDRDLRCS